MAETAANRLYVVARRALALKQFHWINDEFWIAYLSAAYTPDTIEHVLWSQVTPAARLIDVGPLGNKTVDDEGWCTAGPVSIARVTTAAPITQAVIYRHFADDPASDYPVVLMTQIDGLPVRLDHDFFQVQFGDAGRVFRP